MFSLLLVCVVLDYSNLKQKAKQYKQKTSLQSYKPQINIVAYKSWLSLIRQLTTQPRSSAFGLGLNYIKLITITAPNLNSTVVT